MNESIISNKSQIFHELKLNVGKTCLFDIYKEDQFCFSTIGKLESFECEKYFEVKNFSFFLDSIDNVTYFGIMLRIQVRP